VLRVSEVANRLNVSAQCVYQLIAAGRLAAHRIGMGRGTIRIAEVDLEHFLLSAKDERVKSPTRARRPTLKHIQL